MDTGLTSSAWALCIVSAILALASVGLASFNGDNLIELVANHHAIGILNAIILPLLGALIAPLCRFEVVVRDNDGNLAGSKGDFFSIRLSSGTVRDDALDPATVFYARAGYLAGGNLTVK